MGAWSAVVGCCASTIAEASSMANKAEITPEESGMSNDIIGQGIGSHDHASTPGSHATRPNRSPDLCRQRSHEPDSYRAFGPYRLESQTARQGPQHCRDLHAHAQCPLQVGQTYSSASEGSTTAQPRTLHAAAGPCGISRERRSLRRDVG